MEDSQNTRILAQMERLRRWLRMHGDYRVTIDLWDVYGCYMVTVKYLTTTQFVAPGMHLDIQLDKVIAYLKA